MWGINKQEYTEILILNQYLRFVECVHEINNGFLFSYDLIQSSRYIYIYTRNLAQEIKHIYIY